MTRPATAVKPCALAEAGATPDVAESAEPAESAETAAPTSWHRAWLQCKRYAPWLLSALVLGLLARQVHLIAWPAVWLALQNQSRGGLALAAALSLLSYLAFASYDLVGRHLTGHRVRLAHTLGIAATCYAFNVNFGALVGALALKLRLYARAGVSHADSLRVIGLSVVTNWLGYLVVGGAVLVLAPPPLPSALANLPPFSNPGLQVMGALMLAAGTAYLLLCASGPQGGRTLAWRRHRMPLPGGRAALWQLTVAAVNWSLMGLIVWVLLDQRVPYPTVLGVLLLAAVAGVVAHVPAGLGVIEGVFVACLGGLVPQGSLLAALLAYRATYYLLPLAVAGLGYLVMESANKRLAQA